jgi:hypothetical protein
MIKTVEEKQGMAFYIAAAVKNGKNDGGRFPAVLAAMVFGVYNVLLIWTIVNRWRSNSLEIGLKPQ